MKFWLIYHFQRPFMTVTPCNSSCLGVFVVNHFSPWRHQDTKVFSRSNENAGTFRRFTTATDDGARLRIRLYERHRDTEGERHGEFWYYGKKVNRISRLKHSIRIIFFEIPMKITSIAGNLSGNSAQFDTFFSFNNLIINHLWFLLNNSTKYYMI